jgi:amidase
MAGLADRRPHWAPPPERPFRALALEKPRRFRIKLALTTPFGPTHPEIAAAVERAAKIAADLGHRVEPGVVPDGSLEEFLPLWQHMIAQFPLARWERAQPITRWLAEPGKKLRTRDVRRLHASIEARLKPPLEEPDIWLTPAVAQPAPRIGAYANRAPADAFADAAQLGAFTAAFNLTGQPAASLPIGLTSDGLPIGLQIAGRTFAEADVLQLSHELEQAIPFRARPPLR